MGGGWKRGEGGCGEGRGGGRGGGFLKRSAAPPHCLFGGEMALVISNLQKRFGKRIVLDRLTLNLESGHVYVIVGANGSGKTTLMNIINDLVPADDGVLSLDGYPLGDLKFKKAIYYLPSDFYLPEYLTGVE